MSRRRFLKLVSHYVAGVFVACFSAPLRASALSTARADIEIARSGIADTADPVEPRCIAFGSCNHTHLPQPMWSHIESHRPDLFLWLGDVVYADTSDPVEMARQFQVQLAHPEYQKVVNNMPVLGIWDDHDYGGNNLGRDNPIKVQGQQLFLDFLGEPANSVRRTQQGIYTTYSYGSGDKQVKIFLLDTRYHRERGGRGRASLLGSEQWRWLEAEFKKSRAAVNLIASGSSVLSTQIPGGEEWADFRWEKKRLFRLIEKHHVKGVLFLTGDRHFAAHLTETVSGRTYHELMCSGLTHFLNRPKAKFLMELFLGKSNCYFGRNFGLLHFDWAERVRADFEVYDQENKKRLHKYLHLQDGIWVLSAR